MLWQTKTALASVAMWLITTLAPTSSAAQESDLTVQDGSGAQDVHPGPRSKGTKITIKSLAGSTVEAGNTVGFRIKSNAPGFVHLYSVNASGRIQLWMENVPIEAAEPLSYPSDPRMKIKATPPGGKDRVLVILTKSRLDGFQGRRTTRVPEDIEMGQASFLKHLKELMSDVPRAQWTWAETSVKVVE